MKFSKHAKMILLDGTRSKIKRKDVVTQIYKFRLFVRDRDGIWRQITEDTKLVNPVLVIYDEKKGGGMVKLHDPLLCDFTDAMLFWEDVLTPYNLLCFTKEEDKDEHNIIKISANGKRISDLFDKFLPWADKALLHSNMLEKSGTVQTIITSNIENDASESFEGE